MNKSKILIALACIGLLVTACGAKQESSEVPSSNAQSQAPSSVAPSSAAPSSSQPSDEEGDYKFYSLPFGNDVPDGGDKWEKGKEYKWTFDVKEAHKEMTFAFGAQMSSSSHTTRSLFTNHDGASSSDSFESNAANDGTPRITLKVNGETQCLTRATYEEAGLDSSEIHYFKVATFGVKAGKIDVSLTTNANAGYRLIIGEQVRLYYPKTESTAAAGYTVTFAGEHAKVYVYPSKTYEGVEPTLATSTETVDDTGAKVKYAIPSKLDENLYDDDEVKPQVNFKVVCDEGYKMGDNSVVISGSEGMEWNALKAQGNNIYRITKIKANIAVTIVPVVDEGEETIDAGKVTFVLTNCTVKVYIGPKNDAGDNVDAGPDFYSRSKTEPYGYLKGDNAQFNFEVVPNNGYQFVDPTTYDDSGEAKANNVTFISGSYNKLKKKDTNIYNITKVAGDLTITLNCTAAA